MLIYLDGTPLPKMVTKISGSGWTCSCKKNEIWINEILIDYDQSKNKQMKNPLRDNKWLKHSDATVKKKEHH